MTHSYRISQFQGLDPATTQRLHSLGLQIGSRVQPIRFYPFHGPVIVSVDHQQIGIRYSVFQTLIGGQLDDDNCFARESEYRENHAIQ